MQQLADNLWLVEGPMPLTWIRRTMIVARDQHGRLLLHSAIALDAPGVAALEALGTPTWLVVPNGYHRLDAPAYKQRYPGLQVIAPVGATARVRKVVDVDVIYDQFASNSALRLEQAPWEDAAEGVVHVRSADGATLVFNDLVWTPPDVGFAARIHRALRQKPQVPLIARHMHAPRGRALRDWLEQLAQTPDLVRIVPGHGAPITHNARQALQRIAATA
jgi:hypothetical protein